MNHTNLSERFDDKQSWTFIQKTCFSILKARVSGHTHASSLANERAPCITFLFVLLNIFEIIFFSILFLIHCGNNTCKIPNYLQNKHVEYQRALAECMHCRRIKYLNESYNFEKLLSHIDA